MLISTVLYAIVICVVFNLPVIIAIVFFLVFGFIDGAFLGSTLLKVKSGGRFTLSIAILLLFIMLIWRWGTTLKLKYELKNKTRLDDIFANNFPEQEAQESDSEDSGQTDEI